jgi:hypothetical protein
MLAVTHELGRFEESFSEVIYPAWPLWLLAAGVVVGVAGYVAYRAGFHHWAISHRALTAAGVVLVLLAAIPMGYYTVSPLFERETVCEASPIAGSGSGSEDCDSAAVASTDGPWSESTPVDSRAVATPEQVASSAAAPAVVARGEFMGADDFHFGEGQALLIEAEPGKYVLRFEEFSVRNGPDLFVYLSTDAEGFGDGALKLGGLKGTDGAFNYEVPAGTDISRFRSAIVWCDQFSVLFATAPLM